jgi:hypothetical protein
MNAKSKATLTKMKIYMRVNYKMNEEKLKYFNNEENTNTKKI